MNATVKALAIAVALGLQVLAAPRVQADPMKHPKELHDAQLDHQIARAKQRHQALDRVYRVTKEWVKANRRRMSPALRQFYERRLIELGNACNKALCRLRKLERERKGPTPYRILIFGAGGGVKWIPSTRSSSSTTGTTGTPDDLDLLNQRVGRGPSRTHPRRRPSRR